MDEYSRGWTTTEPPSRRREHPRLGTQQNRESLSKKCGLQNALLSKELPEIIRVKIVLVWHHLEDAGQVGKQVALVPICQNCRHTGIVELDVFEVHLDKVDGGVGGDEGNESRLNGC